PFLEIFQSPGRELRGKTKAALAAEGVADGNSGRAGDSAAFDTRLVEVHDIEKRTRAATNSTSQFCAAIHPPIPGISNETAVCEASQLTTPVPRPSIMDGALTAPAQQSPPHELQTQL